MLELAGQLAGEVHPALQATLRVRKDSALDADLGLDSLGRVELLTRVERAFDVELSADTLVRATTAGALVQAVLDAHPARHADVARAPVTPTAPQLEAPAAARTLVDVFAWHAAQHPDATHLVLDDTGEALSFGALHEAARRVAAGLARRGVQPGEPVALMLPTGRDFFEAFVGALYAGAVPVPLYPPTSAARLEEHVARQSAILANAEARLLVTDAVARAEAPLLKARAPVLRHVETVARLAEAPAGDAPPYAARPTDLALLQYTSGSTGDPKGVMLSHANLLANVRAMGRAMQVTPRDVFVSWLPLYHDMGLIGAWLGSALHSVRAVILSPLRFLTRPEAWLWAVHAHRGTLTASPNFAWELCLSKVTDAQLEGLDLSSLRLVFNGAEPVSASTVERFARRFARYGLERRALAPVYGLAETSVGLCFPPPGRGPRIDSVDREALSSRGEALPVAAEAPGALAVVGCGRPLKDHAVRIVGPLGRELEPRREGKVEFQGPSATSGYWHNPEKTRKLFDGAWLDTGDTGYVADGELFLTGRAKDLIIRAGQHVHPHELEAAVGAVPGVRKGCVAVFGVPEARTRTERVVVVAEARAVEGERAALAARILEAVRPLMGEPPDDVVVVAPHAVPKTPSGKLRRTACRELYERGLLTQRARAPRWLGLRLAAGVGRARLRRVASALATVGFAAWFWFVIGLAFALGWPAVMATPGAARKRAVLGRIARLALALLGTRLSVDGDAALTGARLVAINHSSYLDGLVAAAVLPPRFRFVAKSELASQFIAGPFLRGLGTIFVEREGVEAAPQKVAELARALEGGAALVVFPEGTLRRAPGLMPFHLGGFLAAADAGVAVTPVVFNGTRTLLRGDQWFPRRARVAVQVAEPVQATGTGWAGALSLRDGVRTAMLRRLGEPDLADR